uniref:Uncharacterized protein n=1 Tax=Rhizophora mucronata TaxID=61149 RepID=A0A2P2J0D9_RHIMU
MDQQEEHTAPPPSSAAACHSTAAQTDPTPPAAGPPASPPPPFDPSRSKFLSLPLSLILTLLCFNLGASSIYAFFLGYLMLFMH